MNQTSLLLERALKKKNAAAWCRELNISRSTFSMAKKKGQLSPALAGCLAMKLGEDRNHWIALAAIETEREGPLKEQMLQALLHTKPWVKELEPRI